MFVFPAYKVLWNTSLFEHFFRAVECWHFLGLEIEMSSNLCLQTNDSYGYISKTNI